MLLLLALVACVPKLPVAPPTPQSGRPTSAFPLDEGLQWTWRIEERSRQARLLFIIKQPDLVERTATRTLELVDSHGGRTQAVVMTDPPVDGLTTRTDLTLWNDGDTVWMDRGQGTEVAFEISTPPYPVSTERVPCVVHFLDNAAGWCSPAPGGPLGVWPLVEQAQMLEDIDALRATTSLLIAMTTLGLIAPGGAITHTSMVSEDFADSAAGRYTPQASQLLAAYKDSRGWGEKRIRRALRIGPVNREEVAALAIQLRADTGRTAMTKDVIRVALDSLHPQERYSVIRALQGHVRAREGLDYLLLARDVLPPQHRPDQLEAMRLALGNHGPFGVCLLERRCGYGERWLHRPPNINEPIPTPVLDDVGVLLVISPQVHDDVVQGLMSSVNTPERPEMLLRILQTVHASKRRVIRNTYEDVVASFDETQRIRLEELVPSP